MAAGLQQVAEAQDSRSREQALAKALTAVATAELDALPSVALVEPVPRSRWRSWTFVAQEG